MSLRRRWPIVLFLVWTAYVWTTRIVNAWTASDESTGAKVLSSVVASGLLVLTAFAAAALIKARSRRLDAGQIAFFGWFVRVTWLVWALRIPQILLDGARDVPFKVVHVVLGAISIGLAALALARVKAEADAVDGEAGAPSKPSVSPAAKASR
jgi:hypothetical protein